MTKIRGYETRSKVHLNYNNFMKTTKNKFSLLFNLFKMSNESNPDLRISSNNINLEFSSEDNSPGSQSPRVEAKQEKPKRKYNKQKQQEPPAEPCGIRSTVH